MAIEKTSSIFLHWFLKSWTAIIILLTWTNTKICLYLMNTNLKEIYHIKHCKTPNVPTTKCFQAWQLWLWNITFHLWFTYTFLRLISGKCEVNNCELVFDYSLFDVADAVLFHPIDLDLSNLPLRHRPNQPWVFFTLEPPPGNQMY